MIQVVLTNEDDIIIDSAKVKSQDEVLSLLTEWIDEYGFMNGDSITFYYNTEKE